jgi:GH24 family phage-related lysozyme (muramidase)
MKVLVTEEQFKKVICEEVAGNQAMVNPRMVYAGLMKALSMGNISMEDAVQYPDRFSGKLRDILKNAVNNFFNKDKQVTDKMKADAEEQAKPATTVSENAISQICKWETRKDFGYQMQPKDLNGYFVRGENKKTYGYGLRTHPNGQYMQDVKAVWTQPELEQLFKQKIGIETNWVLNWANKNNVQLGQGQLDAMVSAVYNYGRTGFLKTGMPALIAQNPNNPAIPQRWAHLSDARAAKYPGLVTRRAEEANWYQNDIQTQA